MIWLPAVTIFAAKPLAQSTLQQKLSHLNFMAELMPEGVVIAGGKLSLPKLMKGLGQLHGTSSEVHILPPSFLITLSLLQKPQLIHLAVQLQALLGLRAGQMCLLTPMHLATESMLLVPPFKHQRHTQECYRYPMCPTGW